MATPIPTDSKEKRILSAARAIFSTEGGALILEFLEAASFMHRPAFIPGADGKICAFTAAHNDGRRALVYELRKLISRAKADEETEPKPKAKR